MPLRPAQRGYRYQDFVCARIILQQMFEQGNPIEAYDWGASLVGFDFLFYSLYYDISPTYDLNYNYDLSKSDEIAGKVIDFISYSRTKLTKAEIQTIRKKSPNNFIFSFFEYIININDAFKAEDLKERDTLLVKALETFIEICQPFSGSPRSMDLSMPLFRKVFLLQLLSPINYITEIESQLVFIKNILKLYDKIQARLIDKLIDNSLISLATNLIAYVVGINERSALENETNYNCLNKLSKKINYTLPPFRKVTINHESRKESSYFVPSLEEIIDNPHLAWNLHTDDLIYLVNLMPYEESTKQLIVDIFYEAKSSHYSCEEINKLIDLRIENEEKKVFVYMCVFVIWNDGWLGQFVHIDSAKAAYSINEQKTKEHFFEIAQLLRKHSFFSFHSVGNYLKYLLSINTPSQNILDIWTDVWDFANRRLPDLSEKIQEITKPDNNINDISTQLIIANINNFSEDNYRRAFCYIKKCLDCDVSTVQSIADFVFGNWENINLVAQLSFVYNLCFTNYESLELAEKYKDKILGGKNILISAIGAIVFNEEINTYRTDLSTIKSSNPISDEFLEYSRCFIFNYNIVSSFCQFFKINESNILNYHKDNLKNNYQDFTNEFWSNYYKIFSNNTIAYNSFLEAVDIVLIDSYNNHLVSLNDIYELSSIIADLNQEAFSQPTMPIIKRDDEVLLAEYKLEVIFNYESGAERKVNYNVLGLKLDDKIINIIQNNLQELDQGINYINQIRFYLLDDIVNHLNWSHNIIDGCEVLVDENNNIIARYLTNKYGLLGLESCHDQIYKYQDGKLYITSDAFGKLKTFFDSPNTNLCMKDTETFIFHNHHK